jgi:hypothetical protein
MRFNAVELVSALTCEVRRSIPSTAKKIARTFSPKESCREILNRSREKEWV